MKTAWTIDNSQKACSTQPRSPMLWCPLCSVRLHWKVCFSVCAFYCSPPPPPFCVLVIKCRNLALMSPTCYKVALGGHPQKHDMESLGPLLYINP